jgi:hypothetical protein
VFFILFWRHVGKGGGGVYHVCVLGGGGSFLNEGDTSAQI